MKQGTCEATRLQRIIIEDAGHTMFGEKPEECINIINNYFDEE